LFICDLEKVKEFRAISVNDIQKKLVEIPPTSVAWLNIYGLRHTAKIIKINDASQALALIEKQRENFNYLKRFVLPLRDALFSLKSIQDDDNFNGNSKVNVTFFIRLHQKRLELFKQAKYDINMLESASNLFYSTQNQRMNQII
jgi:hypothetical protein